MRKSLFIFFIFACLIIYTCDGSAVIRIEIFDYRNEHNLMHNGAKCENFHWMGDHCDPMFKICVTSNYPCNLLSKFIDFWKNTKSIGTVMSQDFAVEKIPRSINIKVTADDHDRYDAHDHIAVFSTDFVNFNVGEYDEKTMYATPSLLGVSLRARMKVQCSTHYYGNDCETYCFADLGVYYCDERSGKKICILYCGYFGTCEYDTYRNNFHCVCQRGWTGNRCDIMRIVYQTPKTSTTSKITLSTRVSSFASSTISSTTIRPTIASTTQTMSSRRRTIPTSASTTQTVSSKHTILPTSVSTTKTMLSTLTSSLSKISLPSKKPLSTPGRIVRNIGQETKKIFKYASTKNPSIMDTSTSNNHLLMVTTRTNNVHFMKINISHDNLKVASQIKEKGNSEKMEITVYQIGYFVLTVILVGLVLWFGSRYFKMKYKMKSLRSSSALRPLPPIIYRRKTNPKVSIPSWINDSLINPYTLPILPQQINNCENYEEISTNINDTQTWNTDC